MKLIIKKSKLGGKGSFANEDIKKGEFIKTLTGEKVSEDEIDRRIDTGEERVDDPLQIGNDLHLDLDEPSRLINHSCNPNAGMRGESELFAIRDIKKGEEISYDYSSVTGKEFDWWVMDCNCGAKDCRKKISDVATIPKEILKKYQELGALPDFIINQLKND